jgi:hypothetical protein
MKDINHTAVETARVAFPPRSKETGLPSSRLLYVYFVDRKNAIGLISNLAERSDKNTVIVYNVYSFYSIIKYEC